MQAEHRLVKTWLDYAIRGEIMLPRFQRQWTWKHHNVEKFITAMLQRRPLGVFLVLRVDPDNQPFNTRSLNDNADLSPTCREHLLDGQQRLRSLLQVFHDQPEDYKYYCRIVPEDQSDTTSASAIAIPINQRNRPWVGVPAREYEKSLIPLNIIAPPTKRARKASDWREAATPDHQEQERIEELIDDLRSRIDETVIPYLVLPQDTSSSDAIRIFLETNQSSVRLTEYDIAVAQMERKTGESLQEFVDEVVEAIPELQKLEPKNVGDLVLKLECVIQGKRPTYGNYSKLKFDKLNQEKSKRIEGLEWAIKELSRIKLWDESRLPTAVPLRVLPALEHKIPNVGTKRDHAIRIIRRYLWCSFLTDRYERQANDRLKEDHDALVHAIENPDLPLRVPAFEAKIPNHEEIKLQGWPKSGGRLSRGILAVCCQGGAKDLASNEDLDSEGSDDFHHIFPREVLKGTDKDPDIAINCMLLTPHTNQKEWRTALPGDYIRSLISGKLIQQSVLNPDLEIKSRLKTHLLPVKQLLNVTESTTEDVSRAYEQFVEARINLIKKRIKSLLERGEFR